ALGGGGGGGGEVAGAGAAHRLLRGGLERRRPAEDDVDPGARILRQHHVRQERRDEGVPRALVEPGGQERREPPACGFRAPTMSATCPYAGAASASARRISSCRGVLAR